MRTSITAALLCIVSVAALSIGAAGAPALAGADGPTPTLQASDEQQYSVIQGDQCVEIRALGNGSQTVEEFYDYRTPETHDPPNYRYSSYGTTDLQRDDTTTMFVYRGSEGTSLVVLHESIEGESDGGAVTMQFDNLSEGSEWAVQDDNYSDDHYGGNIDEFRHSGTSARATWVYTDGRNDGGAIRGIGDRVTITPYFNDNADFRQYPGTVDDWQVVSAAGDGYERTSLNSMTEEVRIVAGSCTELAVSSVTTSPTDPAPNESVDVEATVTNEGNAAGNLTAEIAVDGEVIDTKEVSLGPGESTTVTTSTTFEEPGTYEITVANTTTTVEVTESSGISADVLPGFGVAVALVALLCAAALAHRRR